MEEGCVIIMDNGSYYSVTAKCQILPTGNKIYKTDCIKKNCIFRHRNKT
jgi:hypothetical protein